MQSLHSFCSTLHAPHFIRLPPKSELRTARNEEGALFRNSLGWLGSIWGEQGGKKPQHERMFIARTENQMQWRRGLKYRVGKSIVVRTSTYCTSTILCSLKSLGRAWCLAFLSLFFVCVLNSVYGNRLHCCVLARLETIEGRRCRTRQLIIYRLITLNIAVNVNCEISWLQ